MTEATPPHSSFPCTFWMQATIFTWLGVFGLAFGWPREARPGSVA